MIESETGGHSYHFMKVDISPIGMTFEDIRQIQTAQMEPDSNYEMNASD